MNLEVKEMDTTEIWHLFSFFGPQNVKTQYRVAAIFPEHFQSFTVALKIQLFY